MADTDKKPAKPAPDTQEKKVDTRESGQELDEAALDEVSGGVVNLQATTGSGKRGR